jgi:hypothetical protein
MILEEVERHPHRQDIYIDNVITPHELVKENDKLLINLLLSKEVSITIKL